jgi:hypothetical protein
MKSKCHVARRSPHVEREAHKLRSVIHGDLLRRAVLVDKLVERPDDAWSR